MDSHSVHSSAWLLILSVIILKVIHMFVDIISLFLCFAEWYFIV